MQKLRNKLIALAAVGILAVIGALMNTHPASAAGGPSVTIDGPLPLPVSAAQSGAWNVGITGTPNVGVSGTVAVSSLPAVTLNGTSPVSISNNQFSPIYVEPDAAAANFRYPSYCILNGSLSPYQDGQNACSISGPSSGYRLAMETVSLIVQVPSNTNTIVENAFWGVYQAPPAATIPTGFIVLHKVSSDPNRNVDNYTGQATVPGYFASTESIGCGITTTVYGTPGNFQMQCNISGHLVPGT